MGVVENSNSCLESAPVQQPRVPLGVSLAELDTNVGIQRFQLKLQIVHDP